MNASPSPGTTDPAAEPPGLARSAPGIEDFLEEPTRDLHDWRWLWAGDHQFPVRSHRGLVGSLVVLFKRLARPFVQTPQNELWDRQRTFNLILLEHLTATAARLDAIDGRLTAVEALVREGLDEITRHHDALYSRVDMKLDEQRANTRELLGWARSALRVAESQPRAGGRPDASGAAAQSMPVLARAFRERGYAEFERRFRGTEDEIGERIAAYLPYLREASPILDLGCGRGEALRVFTHAGLLTRGVDGSGEMVARCREQGLDAVEAELLAHLEGIAPAALGAVVSFHVIEHLPPDAIARLVASAYAALRPGGLLILETPNPLSVVVSARSFWLDPTHLRPVHPDYLRELARSHGFDGVEVLPLRPFQAAERLPELPLAELPAELRGLADRVNQLRDRLDNVLFGHQDYALLARKPR